MKNNMKEMRTVRVRNNEDVFSKVRIDALFRRINIKDTVNDVGTRKKPRM